MSVAGASEDDRVVFRGQVRLRDGRFSNDTAYGLRNLHKPTVLHSMLAAL